MKSYIIDRQTAFVPHPATRGLWLRVHSCVVLAPCPEEGCHVAKGVPCHGARGSYTTSTHYRRRDAARG